MRKHDIRIGILGATGTVGQRMTALLEGHPWFTVTALGAIRAFSWEEVQGCRALDARLADGDVVSSDLACEKGKEVL